jgi:hypothetical protein
MVPTALPTPLLTGDGAAATAVDSRPAPLSSLTSLEQSRAQIAPPESVEPPPAKCRPVSHDAEAPEFNHLSPENPPRVGQVLAGGLTDYQVVTHFAHDHAKSVGFTQKLFADNKGADGGPRRLRIQCGNSRKPAPSNKVEDSSQQRRVCTSKRVGRPYSVTIWKTTNRPGKPTVQGGLRKLSCVGRHHRLRFGPRPVRRP